METARHILYISEQAANLCDTNTMPDLKGVTKKIIVFFSHRINVCIIVVKLLFINDVFF